MSLTLRGGEGLGQNEDCVSSKAAAAPQRRQIVAGQKYASVMPALMIFQEELGFM